MSDYKYTLHRKDDAEHCEADSLPELVREIEYCGVPTKYFIRGSHWDLYICKVHRERMRELGLVK